MNSRKTSPHPPAPFRAYDSSGERVDVGKVEVPASEPHVVKIRLGSLPDGGYAVTWRVTSADSHLISGAYSFSVGDVAVGTGAAEDLLTRGQSEDPGSVALSTISRILLFGGLIVFVGSIAYALFVSGAVRRIDNFRRITWLSGAVALAGTLLGLLIQGPYVSGLGVGHVLNGELLGQTLDTNYGKLAVLRLGLLVVAVAVVLKGRTRISLSVAAVLGVATLGTITLYGHAVTGRLIPLAVPSDVLHMAAAAAWLGGLVVLLIVGLRSRATTDLLSHVTRFSRLAIVSVVVVVSTGTFQSWRQIGSFDAIFQSTYGLLLGLKILLVAALLLVARQSHRWVTSRYEASKLDDDSKLTASIKRSVAFEVAVGVVVVIVTAFLVNTVPASAQQDGPENLTFDIQPYQVQLTVDPATAGTNEIHLYVLERTGSVVDVDNVEMSISLPSSDIDSIDIPLSDAGPGHRVAYDASIPLRGNWTVKVDLQIDDYTKRSATQELTVR